MHSVRTRASAQILRGPQRGCTMALKSRLQSMTGRLEETEDFVFDQLHDNFKALKAFAGKQKKAMNSYLEKSRATCYASVSSAEEYCAFFESSAGGATTGSALGPQRRRIAKGPNGYGMAIEEDGTVSGYTGQDTPAELAGVAIGMKIVAVNGIPTPGKTFTIAELQRCGSAEVEFTFEAPSTAALSAVSSSFGVTVREIKARNENFSRETRGDLESTLITDVLEPLDAYIALFSAFQDLINDRQRARELYDRYRAKVRDLSGSSRDPTRLPRNEQKMKTAFAEYQRCNAHAISQLSRFHRESVTFFGGLQRAHLAHQAAMFSAGHSTFESLLSMMTSALNDAGMPIKPVLPNVDAGEAPRVPEHEPEPECVPTIAATASTVQPPPPPFSTSSANPFAGGAASTQPAGHPQAQVHAQTIMAQPVQPHPTTVSSAIAPPPYSPSPGVPLATDVAPDASGSDERPPPPPYDAPAQTVQLPPRQQHPVQQKSASALPASASMGLRAPPPSYNDDPFAAPSPPSSASLTSSDTTFSSVHGMAPTAISAANPFGASPFDGTGGPAAAGMPSGIGVVNVQAGQPADTSASDPFGMPAMPSSTGSSTSDPFGTPAMLSSTGSAFDGLMTVGVAAPAAVSGVGQAAHTSVNNPFGLSAMTSSTSSVFGEQTAVGVAAAPAPVAGVDFPSNLPPALGGRPVLQSSPGPTNLGTESARNATRPNRGGWQTFD